jgi:hypothetical protein
VSGDPLEEESHRGGELSQVAGEAIIVASNWAPRSALPRRSWHRQEGDGFTEVCGAQKFENLSGKPSDFIGILSDCGAGINSPTHRHGGGVEMDLEVEVEALQWRVHLGIRSTPLKIR